MGILDPEDFKLFLGRGITARVGTDRVMVGKADFFRERGGEVDPGLYQLTLQQEAQGNTVMVVAVNDQPKGLIMVADQVKPSVGAVIAQLKETWRQEVLLLTGDSRNTAESIAGQAGIDQIYADQLPQDKVRVLAEKRDQGKKVCMIGDGINDAPALAQADIGMAIGGGSDIAIEAGDIVIIANNLNSIPTALRLAASVMKNIRQNLFWAFAFNTIGIPVAAGLLTLFGGPSLSPMIAGAAMAFSSVAVVSNSLRLRSFS